MVTISKESNVNFITKERLVWLQLFRGIAATIVVMHHISGSTAFYFKKDLFGGFFKAGWLGVDFFFVLSGFIITYIHYKDIGNVKIIKKYFLKRFIRIYPIYWTAALLALSFYFNAHTIIDWLYITKSTLLIPQNKDPYLSVAWTLVYEVGFYILFGLYILIGKKWTLVLFVSHIILIFLTHWHYLSFSNQYLLLFSNSYNLEFISGSLTAVLYLKYKLNMRQAIILLIFALILLVTLWQLSLCDPNFSKYSFVSRLSYGFTFSCLTYSVSLLPYESFGAFSTFLRRLGDSSYSIYLFHLHILAFFYKLTNLYLGESKLVESSLTLHLVGLISLLFCVVIGFFVHYKVENKLIKVSNELIK